MNTATGTHPTPDELATFIDGGDISPTQRDEIEGHIATCASCCEVLGARADNPFVAQVRAAVRQAAGLGRTPVEGPDTPGAD